MNYVCAIIKDEHDYIREWVLHNKSIGFDKVFLYDNKSSEAYDNDLGDLIKNGFVQIKLWDALYKNPQTAAYMDLAQNNIWQDNDWCAFIDPDEYICLDENKTILDFLKRYSAYDAVVLFWKCYNASGHIKKPMNSTHLEAYTQVVQGLSECQFKTIARLNKIRYFGDSHRPIMQEGSIKVTTSGKSSYDDRVKDYAVAHIKHYLTRSWEDYLKKLRRGNITCGLRTIDFFFKINPDMEYLKEKLVKDLDFSTFPTIDTANEQSDKQRIYTIRDGKIVWD